MGVFELGKDVVDNFEDIWKDIFFFKRVFDDCCYFRFMVYWLFLEVEFYVKIWGNIKKKIKIKYILIFFFLFNYSW